MSSLYAYVLGHFWQIVLWTVGIGLALAILRALRTLIRTYLRQQGLREGDMIRESLNDIVVRLFKGDLGARIAALLAVQRLPNSRGMADALVAFVRSRLSAEGRAANGATPVFEDVVLAMNLISLPSVRASNRARNRPVDYSGIDFRSVPLVGIDFSEMNCANCTFDGADMRGAQLRAANLSGASFARCNLSTADLEDADLTGADLTDVDLTKARLRNAKFQDSDISGAILVDALYFNQKQLDLAIGDMNTAVPDRLRFVPAKTQRAKPAIQIVHVAE